VDSFPRDVDELQHYFGEPEPGQRVRAVPGAGLNVPIWILGSSLYGAQLAAALGLPYAFASHFAPAAMMRAIEVYRSGFQPSEQLAKPHVMLGFNVFAAATDDEARLLMTSVKQSFLNLRHGNPGRLPPPDASFDNRLMPSDRNMLDEALACSVAGSPQTVLHGLEDFVARTGADEIMVTSHIFDHAKRLRSFEIVADVAIDQPG
jgi:luciferase family oxidoreductase group 1